MTKQFEKTFDFTRSDSVIREYLEFAPVGILLFQENFIVKYVNNNFFLFNGVIHGNPENLVGKSIYALL